MCTIFLVNKWTSFLSNTAIGSVCNRHLCNDMCNTVDFNINHDFDSSLPGH